MSPISQFPASGGSSSPTYTSGTTAERPASPTAGSTYYNTSLGELQIFQNGVWTALQMPALAKAPTIVSLTDNGSGKAYGANGSVTIAYTQNQEGGFAPNFTAVSTPGSLTQTSAISNPSTSNTITVNGLTSNTSYTFTLTGTNASGAGATTTTNSILATTVPQAPQAYAYSNVTATSLTLSWTAGNTGGKAVTYRIKNNTTNTSVTASSETYTFTGLSGTVSFNIYSVNANGDSLPLTTESVVMGPYTTLQTFTSSGTHTVQSGITQLSITAIGSGANGSAGNTSNGGNGARGAGAAIVWNFPVTTGDQFVISIPGSGGGSTTVTKSGQATLISAGATVSVDSAQTANYATANPGTGGTGGNNGNGPTTGTSGGAGNSLTYPTTITNISGNQAVNTGSGGGGGGGGGAFNEARVTVINGPYTGYYRYYSYQYYTTSYYFLASSLNNPSAGGASGGTGAGTGGAGGTGMFVSAGSIVSDTVQGSNGTNYGAGGGGSGGISSGKTSSNAVGGSGSQGVVYIYGR
jgi:hypothetical protein